SIGKVSWSCVYPCGAKGETRTLTGITPLAPKASASTDSATFAILLWARCAILQNVYIILPRQAISHRVVAKFPPTTRSNFWVTGTNFKVAVPRPVEIPRMQRRKDTDHDPSG